MNQKYLTKEQIEEAISGSRTKIEAAKKLGISTDTLSTKLKKFNITFNTRFWKRGQVCESLRQHPEINKEWLIANWVNTINSIKQLSILYGVSDSLIESRIVFYKLKKTFKHRLSTTKFFNLNDPHIWYIAGLATTDGYFPKDQDALIFELVGDSEKLLLENIKSYYECTQEIKQYSHLDKHYHVDRVITNYLRLQAPGLQEFFVKNFKISLREKTFKTCAPTIFPDESCAKAYVRGCLDGDGYISADCKTVNICTASKNFVYAVADIVELYTGVIANKSVTKRGNSEFPICIWRTNKAKAVLTWIYSVDDCFRLDRKYQRYYNSLVV